MNCIHHIAIVCSDKKAAPEYYRDKLGVPVIRENYRPERDDWKIDLRLNDATEPVPAPAPFPVIPSLLLR